MEGVVVVEGWERQSVSKGENKARGSLGVLRWDLDLEVGRGHSAKSQPASNRVRYTVRLCNGRDLLRLASGDLSRAE